MQKPEGERGKIVLKLTSGPGRGVGKEEKGRETAQQAEVLTLQDWGLELNLWNPCKDEKRELTPQICPLVPTGVSLVQTVCQGA